MSSVSYRNFTGTGAENYQRHFVPSIAAPTVHGEAAEVGSAEHDGAPAVGHE